MMMQSLNTQRTLAPGDTTYRFNAIAERLKIRKQRSSTAKNQEKKDSPKKASTSLK